MENISKLVEKQLQEELAVVIDRYHNGDIRREVERRVKGEERIYKALHPGRFDFVSKLRRLWWMVTNNEAFYKEVHNVSKSVYEDTKKEASDVSIFIVFLVLIVLSYIGGGWFWDNAKEYYANLADKGVQYTEFRLNLFLSFVFFGVAPCFLSLGIHAVIKKLHLIAFPFLGLTVLWLLKYVPMWANTFPGVPDLGSLFLLGFMTSGVVALIFILIGTFIQSFYEYSVLSA